TAPPLPMWQALLFSSVIATSLYVCLRSLGAFGRVAALTFLFMLGCMLLSRLNIAEHHLIALVPIAAILVVIASQYVCRRWRSARYLIAAIAVIYLVSALHW